MKTTKLVLPFILLFAGICIQLNAATLTVTNASNSGAGSLRDQIAAAAPGDSITFDSSINGIPIVLTSGEIVIFQPLTINGNGISNTIIDGNDTSRIFSIFPGAANVTIHGLTIQNGVPSDFFQRGGGILNSSLGIVNIDHCAFLSCSVLGDGGGIYTEEGTMNITACTFDGNHAGFRGGGIRISSANVNIEACTITNNTSGAGGGGINNGQEPLESFPGILIVKNTTISGNSAASEGGGARGMMTLINCTVANNYASGWGGGGRALNEYGFALMSNCIFYNNTAGGAGPDLHGAINSDGYNIIGNTSGSSGFVATDLFVNPLLDALADNGGPTKTIALLCNSPAIDAADSATTGTDQRGVAMFGGRRDIGAFESELVCPSLTVSLAGPGTACAFSSETYTTQAGMTNYAWTLSGTAVIDYDIVTGGGAGNSSVLLRWRTDGNHTVTVSYTNPAYPCCTVASGSVTTSVSGATAPFLSGPDQVCVNAVATYAINPIAGALFYDWYTPGSASNYTIISEGGSTDTSITVQWLASGFKHIDLNYMIHLGQGNCHVETSKYVMVHPNPTCQITGDEVICSGGSTTLNAGSHSGYLWSTADTTQTISVNTPGTYTVTVSNSFGCTASASVTITQAQLLVATCSGTNVTCNGGANGTVAVTVTGGVPEAVAQYLWSTGATTSGIGNLTAGVYTVTVTKGSGCSTTCSYTVTAPAALTVDAGPNKFVFRGYPDSSCTTLQSTISGGTPPYTRQWTTGNSNLGSGSSLNVCNLTAPKIYYLTVTDANGCSKTDSARVCVFDVRCGSGNKKVTICHGTGSVTNPFVTLCITPLDALNHFLSHPGEKLGTCSMNRTCSYPIMPNRLDEMTDEEYDMSLTAYPNPASETINISFFSEDSKTYSLRVINITGQILLSETKQAEEGENNFTLNLKGFAAGMYMVLLQSGDNIMQTRIVKQ